MDCGVQEKQPKVLELEVLGRLATEVSSTGRSCFTLMLVSGARHTVRETASLQEFSPDQQGGFESYVGAAEHVLYGNPSR
jgi:hypothetical protein